MKTRVSVLISILQPRAVWARHIWVSLETQFEPLGVGLYFYGEQPKYPFRVPTQHKGSSVMQRRYS